MVVSVDYTKVIEELADQIKMLTTNNAILKAQLNAVSVELESCEKQLSSSKNENTYEQPMNAMSPQDFNEVNTNVVQM